MPTMQLGRYQVIETIGKGGMGEVVLAYDPQLDRQVACKRLRREATAEAQARFQREARLAAQLCHPALVQVFDVLTTPDDQYIVMEYVHGRTLRQRLEEDPPLSLSEKLQIASQIAAGLAYAHQHGVVHRDLKSENVLLTHDGQAKIADFGLARRLQSEAQPSEEGLTSEGMLLGTLRSMSPEQVSGDPLDGRSDLFSFGVLLYEMFTGRSPFAVEDTFETLRRIVQEPHRPAADVNPELPPPLSNLIDHLLEKIPALRPRDAAEVAARLQDLAAAQEDEDTVYVPTPTPEPKPLPSARLWRWVVMVSLALVVVGVWWGFAWWPNRARRVAVLPTQLTREDGEEEKRLGERIPTVVIQELDRLRGLRLIYPTEFYGTNFDLNEKEIAKQLGAEDIIRPKLDCSSGKCELSLWRTRTDQAVPEVGVVGFPVNVDADMSTLRIALVPRMSRVYPRRSLESGMAQVKVNPEDYNEWFAIQNHLRAGFTAEELIDRAREVRTSSPKFPDAYVLEADLLFKLFIAQRDGLAIQEALKLLQQAHELAPEATQPLLERAFIEIQLEQVEEAKKTLDQLAALEPGNPAVINLQAQLWAKQGKGEEALNLYRDEIKRRGSVGLLYNYGEEARKQGKIADARAALQGLKELLQQDPENYRMLSLEARIELVNGDPQTAQRLYEKLAEKFPEDEEALSNRGLAFMLLRDYSAARIQFNQVVLKQLNKPSCLLNLADALYLDKLVTDAKIHYNGVLRLLDGDPAEDGPQLMLRAQALAHLGQASEAREFAQKALAKSVGNVDLNLEAAVVYAVIGDRDNALKYICEAKGFSRSWFELPWFDALQGGWDCEGAARG